MTLNSVSPLNKQSLNIKNRIIIKQLCQKNRKKGGILEKNTQIFSPLYYLKNSYSINLFNLNNLSSILNSNKEEKNQINNVKEIKNKFIDSKKEIISVLDNNKLKKESFYQYLFIHEFSLKEESFQKNSIKNPNSILDSWLTFKNKKISFILENLDLISINSFKPELNNLSLRKDNYLIKKKIKPFFLEDKMFINYKKSFLCYWLLPFLGLLGGAAPVLLKSTNSSLNYQFFENYEKNSFIDIESSFNNYYKINNKKENLKEKNQLLDKEENLNKKNDYSFLMSLNNDTNNRNKQFSTYTIINLYKIQLDILTQEKSTNLFSTEKSLNQINNNLSFSLLNRILKARSNFKWYWFNLSLNKTSLNQIDNNYSLFPSRLSLFNSKNLNRNLNKSNNSILLEKELFKNINEVENSLINSNNKNFDAQLLKKDFSNFLQKESSTKKIPNLFLNNFNINKYEFGFSNNKNNNYFIGVINKFQKSFFYDNFYLEKLTKKKNENPFKSIQKANFLISVTNPSFINFKNSNNQTQPITNIELSTVNSILDLLKKNKSNMNYSLNNILLKTNDSFSTKELKSLNEKKQIKEIIVSLLKSNTNNSKLIIKTSLMNKENHLEENVKTDITTLLSNLIIEGLKNTLDTLIESKIKSNSKEVLKNEIIKLKELPFPLISNLQANNLNSIKQLNKSFESSLLNLETISDKRDLSLNLFKPTYYKKINYPFIENNFLYNNKKLFFNEINNKNSNLDKNITFTTIRGGNISTSTKIKYLIDKNYNNFSILDSKRLKDKKNINLLQNSNLINNSIYSLEGLHFLNNKKEFILNKNNNKIVSTKIVSTKIKKQTDLINKKNQNNNLLFLSKYVQLIKNKIKNKINPYKKSLTYLSQLSLSVSKKNQKQFHSSSKIKINKTLLINNKIISSEKKLSNKYEKKFLSYLSLIKTRKTNSQLIKKNSVNLISYNTTWSKNIFYKTKLKLINKKSLKNKTKKSLNSNFELNNRIKKVSLKSYIKSPSILFKNRLFLNKEIELHKKISKSKSPNLGSKENNSLIEESQTRVRKKQEIKIKRRLKKMKKETRRRKKRKIFYPRPSWITFSVYNKYLSSRHLLKKFINETSSNQSQVLTSKIKINLNKKELNQFKWNKKNQNNNSFWLINNRPKYTIFNNIVTNLSQNSLEVTQNRKLLDTQTQLLNNKEFYKISNPVIYDLKRLLMKSNWLRSYLNPYLEKVKIIYKDMLTISKKELILKKTESFISNFYGSKPSISKDYLLKNQILLSSLGNKQSQPLLSSLIKLEKKGELNFRTIKKRNNLSRYKSINYLEYNRIVYQRIQRIILNIRDNLTLNGQIKNRSKKLGLNIRTFLKRDYAKRDNSAINPNQQPNFWAKLLKHNIFKFGRSCIINDYEESSPYTNAAQLLSRNNFYWALNKSSILNNKNIESSFVKKLWETYKIREISKSNKTKKLIFNFLNKYNRIFKETISIDGYYHIFERDANKNLISMQSNYLNKIKKYTSILKDQTILKYPQIEIQNKPNNLNYSLGNSTILNNTNINKEITEDNFKLLSKVPLEIYTLKSEQKLINIEKKLKLLGLFENTVLNKNNKLLNNKLLDYKNSYFRFLKQQLSNNLPQKNLVKKKNINDLILLNSSEFSNIFFKIKQKSLINFNRNKENYSKIIKMSNNNNYWWSLFKINYSNYDFVFNKNYSLNSPFNLIENNLINMGLIKNYPSTIKELNNNNLDLKFNNNRNFSLYYSKTQEKLESNRNIEAKKLSLIQTELNKTRIETSTLSLTLSTFLFHFCALISFISLGGVRTLIKFYFILFSKLAGILNKAHKINLLPKSTVVQNSNLDKNNPITEVREINTKKIKNTRKLFNTDLIINNKNLLNNFVFNKTDLNILKNTILKYLKIETQKINGIQILKSDSISPFIALKNPRYLFTKINKKFIFDKINSSKKISKANKLIKTQNNRELSYFKKISKNYKFLFSTEQLQNSNMGLVNSELKINLTKSNIIWSKRNLIYKNIKSTILTDIFDAQLIFNKNSLIMSLNKNKLKGLSYSLFKLANYSKFGYKFSFYTYLLLLKSLDLLAAPASFIYKFFEKPGEYVVEILAYSFLVEWSADLISTIPETVDTTQAIYFNKINRNISPLIFMNISLNSIYPFLLKTPLTLLDKLIGSFYQTFLFGISNSILKRFFNSSFLIFIQQICEPDLDYINRQRKGIIFWDIWGEYLKLVAEENSINIYELTTDKEEQIRLLTKYEENILKTESSSNQSQKKWEKILDLGINKLDLNYSLYNIASPLVNKNLFKPELETNLIKKNFKNLTHYKNKILLLFKNQNLVNKKVTKEINFKNNNNYFRNKYIYDKKYNYNAWSVSQFLSYQGKDTDLFIDLHPPKTFSSSAASLKFSFSVQQPIGSIVCQIFSGIFYKQISKNILVIGSSGIEKSLLIQAIAGETELKIITDNAYRYAIVYRGVAVGIKLLRDVFEALSVHTPCIFLMEDIHAIGERRPFLIDEGSPNASESTYNKNQSMQGLFLKEKSNASRELETRNNKHLLSHYKKPYKEVKSLATNHFSFTFLYGDPFRKLRKTEIKLTNAALSIQVTKKENESKYKISGQSENNNQFSDSKNKFNNNKQNLIEGIYSSSLEIKSDKNDLLSPPSSSPFSVLILKESTKLKHKKIVKEMSWFGLPGEQFSLISKYNYSIRIKVALLADLVLSNLSVKLDMITDLLVIIDSVKGNRGFVVFATTHLPYILDPALRRPGRFDETISLPIIPTLYSRWVNYRYNINYLNSSIFTKYTIPLNFNLNKGISLNLTKYNLSSTNLQTKDSILPIDELINYIYKKASSLNQKNLIYSQKRKEVENSFVTIKSKNNLPFYNSLMNSSALKNRFSLNSASNYYLSFQKDKEKNKNQIIQNRNKLINKQFLKIKSKNYSYVSKSLVSLMLYTLKKDPSYHKLKWPSMFQNSNTLLEDYSIYLNLFSYPFIIKIILMSLIAGKLGENFALSSNFKQNKKKIDVPGNRIIENNQFLFNFDNTWKSASSLLLNYIQKRQCSAINKNIAFCSTKLLSFNNKNSLMEAPSPPISNILLPSKRYENYKRTFNNQYRTLTNQNSFDSSVSDKIQLHQQQRLLKTLYKYPIKEFFRSHTLKINSNFKKETNDKTLTNSSNFTNFNNSHFILNSLEKNRLGSLNKLSSVNWCYKNKIYNRHKTYLTNQWWNGQQGEHNAETTFLSDIDWRYTFVQSIGDIQVDFPDADQFYNPRNRRWILTKGDWNNSFNFESEFKNIYEHYIYECFSKVYKYLDQNREIMDFYVELLSQTPLISDLKERDLLNLYKRFYKNSF